MRRVLFPCLLGLAVSGVTAQQPPASETLQSELREQVTVLLAEVQLLVTDKKGDPIMDLRPEDLEVRERGERREVAFLEPFATSDLSARITTRPAPLVQAQPGPPAAPSDLLVLPPPQPTRRIVLLFDAHNSRTPDRKRWLQAARDWVETEMRPSDRVSLAVMERARVRVAVPFTFMKEMLLGHLEGTGIVSEAAYHDYVLDMRNLLDDLQTCVRAYEPDMCSLSAVQSYLHEWRVRTEQTIGGLRRFASSLAAIPGRKAVFYMSDGLVLNPGEMATQAVMATFGTDTMAYNRTSSAFATDLYPDVIRALQTASTAEVTFFTFDTRRSSMRDVSWMADQRVKLHERMVADPFATMFDETRGSLDVVAIETGGRSYHGPKIEENLSRAIRAMEGLYTLGYYRDPRSTGKPKVKVEIARKDVRVSYPDRGQLRTKLPLAARLEIAVATPRPEGRGVLVPVVVQLPLDDLTFVKNDEGGRTADLSVYVEAINREGERAADVFEMLEVPLTEAEFQEKSRNRFGHVVGLVVPAGGYRLRVRLSEADFRHGAERAIDITVQADGTLTPGIQDSVLIQNPEPPKAPPGS